MGRMVRKVQQAFLRVGEELAVTTYGPYQAGITAANARVGTAVISAIASVDAEPIIDNVVTQMRIQGKDTAFAATAARLAIMGFSDALLQTSQNDQRPLITDVEGTNG